MEHTPVLCCAAAGDALGCPFAGRKPTPREPDGFIDTPDDHRSDPVRFSRKGSYSWLTQLCLAASDSLSGSGPPRQKLKSILTDALKEGPPEYCGVFRNVPEHLRPALTMSILEPVCTGHFAVLALPFFLAHGNRPDRALDETAEACLLFSNHFLTASAALAFCSVLIETSADPAASASKILTSAAARLAAKEDDLKRRRTAEFNLLSLSHLHSASSSLEIIGRTVYGPDDSVEQSIAENASRLSGFNIPRPSHPWPLASVLYGIVCGLRMEFPRCAFHAVSRGGESSLTGFIASAIASLRSDPDRPETKSLLAGLSNRKQIQLREESMKAGRAAADLRNFREMERDQSEASALELRRHIRHAGKPAPKKADRTPVPVALPPNLPDRKNKRLWRDFVRTKSKLKKRRRD
jgi:ADP-ribosylglycohydrolase